MPALAHLRHELFAQGVARGLTHGAAYEAAGYAAKGHNAAANAARLLRRRPEVRVRMNELKDQVLGRAAPTLADVTVNLFRLAHEAEKQGGTAGFTAARAALMDLAKLNGLALGKHAGGMTHEDWLAELEVDGGTPGRSD